MKIKSLIAPVVLSLLLLLSPVSVAGGTSGRIDIIPKPGSVELMGGSDFVLNERTVIRYDAASEAQARYLQELLQTSTGFGLRMLESGSGRGIKLSVDPTVVSDAEGYVLKSDSRSVNIVGHDAAGVFYGIQTLLQLFPVEIYSGTVVRGVDWKLPPLIIKDAPERPWRGMMLDVARYFYNKDFVKKYIDMMAMYKLNKLQFHFIDDSGWRLEIKKYPALTEVGAWASTGAYPLGGYYTQEDIKEIIEYASVRGVEIIPEIEFPAHMLSAIVAYPWLSCTGLQHQVPNQHFISRDILCVGKQSSFDFLRDVLEETVALFPSDYINIGGDEAVYTSWENCPYCQRVVKEQGLKDASELQGYLTNVVAEMTKEKGKTVVGWEEIVMRGQVNTPVVGLVWHDVSDSLKIANAGHKAVLTPATHLYFDFPESATPGEMKAAMWMPPVSLEKTYSMPVNDYSEKSATIGVQGCFWSDQFIHGTVLQEFPYLNENRSEKYAEYFTFPRLIALSEVAWGRESERDYEDFLKRISTHYLRLDFKDCNYRVPEPRVVSSREMEGGMEFTLESPIEGKPIRYTTDGTYPTEHSPLYQGPVTVPGRDYLRAMTVASSGHFSLPLYFLPDYSEYERYGKFTTSWKSAQVGTAPSKWLFECTGKINGNGNYRVSFIQTEGADSLHLGRLKVLKRDELMADIEADQLVTTGSVPAQYTFEIKHFEAGTPFTIEVELYGKGGSDTTGYVFIKRMSE